MEYTIDENEEFSRIYAVNDIPPLGRNIKIVADAKECKALAERFNILKVNHVNAQLKLMVHNGGRSVTAKGRLSANINQACIATLKSIPEKIDEELSLLFEDEEAFENRDNILDVEVDISDEDIADPIIKGHFDVGAAVSEHLALAMDPYPRLADVDLNLQNEDELAENIASAGDNPFAVLGTLKDAKGSITDGNES